MGYAEALDRVSSLVAASHPFAFTVAEEDGGFVIRQRGRYVSGPHGREYAIKQADRFNRQEGNYDD